MIDKRTEKQLVQALLLELGDESQWKTESWGQKLSHKTKGIRFEKIYGKMFPRMIRPDEINFRWYNIIKIGREVNKVAASIYKKQQAIAEINTAQRHYETAREILAQTPTAVNFDKAVEPYLIGSWKDEES